MSLPALTLVCARVAIAALILSQLWSGVPGALRVPVLGYVVCLATMAAQWGIASSLRRR